MENTSVGIHRNKVAVSAIQPKSPTHGDGKQGDHAKKDSDEIARADTYAMLAALLGQVPCKDLIQYLASLPDSIRELGSVASAWGEVSAAARANDLDSIDDEYHDLFIGVGRGELLPYGSFYQTGFLMDKPLAELRDDLKTLGFEREQGHKDPEDHIAALFECMSVVIQSGDISEAQECAFFMRHIAPWTTQFFNDLESAKTANFFRSVGRLGSRFVNMEQQYLAMI
ncbi:MAG: TorD/DmsD family molecular chaperone [Arenicellales bacterium WSBS_2016_MAG_OTU3]